jgi:hypothetical protein
MSTLKSVSVDDIRARGSIKDSDVERLRRALADQQAFDAGDAEALCALQAACPIKSSTWAPFFIEAITDYLVHQAKPEGYIVPDKAGWLIRQTGPNGKVETATDLELLVHVIETARWSPPSLIRFTLGQIRQAVATGHGPLRAGERLEAGAISEREIRLLNRVLLAYCRDGGVAVTRAEADVLLDINKLISPGNNSPAWADFFVMAVGTALLSGLGFAVPTRSQAFGTDDLSKVIDLRGTLSTLRATSSPAAKLPGKPSIFDTQNLGEGAVRIWSSCRRQSTEERALSRLQRQRLEIITNEAIEEAEESWIIARLDKPESLNTNEHALIAFLKRETSSLPEALSAFADRASIAA